MHTDSCTNLLPGIIRNLHNIPRIQYRFWKTPQGPVPYLKLLGEAHVPVHGPKKNESCNVELYMYEAKTAKQRAAMVTCEVRTPMQDAKTSNGPKWQRMNIYYNYVLCAISVVLLLL